MTHKELTIAQQISSLVDNDGQRWQTDDGRELEGILQYRAVDIEHRNRGVAGEPIRYVFEDGSSIVVAGPAWDLGLSPHCYCWEGAGHDDACTVELAAGPLERVEIAEPSDLDGFRVLGDDSVEEWVADGAEMYLVRGRSADWSVRLLWLPEICRGAYHYNGNPSWTDAKSPQDLLEIAAGIKEDCP